MLTAALLPAGWWPVAFASLAAVAAALYYYSTSTFGYWRHRNVPYARPVLPLLGNLGPSILGSEHRIRLVGQLYNEFRSQKYGGLFQMRTPYLMVCDPELVHRILVEDFSYFTGHGLYVSSPDENPLANHLFNMDGPQWKIMRNKLSPVFSPAKLKLMYGQINGCSAQLVNNIAKELNAGQGCTEIRDVIGKYSTDVIGTCAFGLQMNAIDDDNSEFRKYGKSVFMPSIWVLIRELSWLITPALRRVLKISDVTPDAIRFFTDAFTKTMNYRMKNNEVRNDVMQSLIQARTDLVVNKSEPSVRFEETDIVANAFIMFAAGFETVSTAMSFCLYELALKKPIQDRVRAEMISMKSKYDGQTNSEFLADLHYLEMVLAETLRKYPPLITLFREATKDYQVPGENLIIEKGTKVIIPTYSLHFDYRYYPDPETFDPERFSPEEKSKRPKGTYSPFGDGPRLCIGKRFAEMEMKLALTELLTKYEVEPCEKTDIPMRYSTKSVIIIPENGIWLRFKPIK